MAKSDKWYLQRLGHNNDELLFLNTEKTTIGRNKKADIITLSDYCSRNHCYISIAADGEITIVDSVSWKKVKNFISLLKKHISIFKSFFFSI